jgi:adenylosuccinate synthase
MTLDHLLREKQIVAVVCNQYGDTGKGKFSDYLSASWADITARGTGGNNAGHTVVVNGKTHVFHILPAGIAYDSLGKTTILGNGMVIDLHVLATELAELRAEGYTHNNLRISEDSYIILPWHVAEDQAKNKSQANGGIGSTGRGIGPAYTDKIARRGIRFGDIFQPDVLTKKLSKLAARYPGMHSVDEVARQLLEYSDQFGAYATDTGALLQREINAGKKVCLEGAQGALLSVEHGIHPYVTSSDCTVNGTASGVGLAASDVDLVLGLIKFPYMNRVGNGPFVTEFGGAHSQQHCDNATMLSELREYSIPHTNVDEASGKAKYNPTDPRIRELLRSKDSFEQGVGLRFAGYEFGATTGRPRRSGWTDAVAARYAAQANGRKQLLVLTKTDVVAGMEEFKVCYWYDVNGTVTNTFPRDATAQYAARPMYETYAGFENIRGITDERQLPASLLQSIKDLEQFTRMSVGIISTGPDQQETIVRDR